MSWKRQSAANSAATRGAPRRRPGTRWEAGPPRGGPDPPRAPRRDLPRRAPAGGGSLPVQHGAADRRGTGISVARTGGGGGGGAPTGHRREGQPGPRRQPSDAAAQSSTRAGLPVTRSGSPDSGRCRSQAVLPREVTPSCHQFRVGSTRVRTSSLGGGRVIPGGRGDAG